jgi:hypothetical protein
LSFIVACFPAIALAQTPSEPDKARELFARDAGTWDCAIKMYFRGPNSTPTEYKGVEVNQLLCEGRCVQTSFSYPMGRRRFEGHALVGYDPRSKQFVGTWVDNFTSAPSIINASYDEAAKTTTEFRTAVDGSGQEVKNKQVTTWLDDATKKLEIYMLVTADGKETEVKLMESTAKKRP